jgi:signal transduction histidine kinase
LPRPTGTEDTGRVPLTAHDHQVALYETDQRLVEVVSDFLHGSDAAVVIATPEHCAQLTAALERAGMDVDAAVADGRLLVLDASETLTRFIDGDRPDPVRFAAVTGDMLDRLSKGGTRSVRAYGEMVAVLWSRGLIEAAIALEDLWNALAETHSFSLLCAYPTAVFDRDAGTESFRTVCAQHTRVIPGERASWLDDAMARTLLERKQRDAESAVTRLREIDEMRNKFVAMVVHDIRSPAVVVRGYLNLLTDTWDELEPDQIREIIATATENIRQIEHLADDMTTVTRLETGSFQYSLAPLSLTGLIHRVASDQRLSTGRVIDTTDVAAQPRVLADERRQAQILTNLLSNAVKFSPPATPVSVALERGARELVVRVRDCGPGLSAAQVAQLFRPFARLEQLTDRRVKGTGLGLYITKALVEGQGGSIWVESEPGAGATFAYSVPLA